MKIGTSSPSGATQNFLLFAVFTLLLVSPLHAQYLETFSTPNRGYLTNFAQDFSGVNWTLSAWTPNSDPINNPIAGRDDDDYFRTNAAGKLEGVDFDQNLCWISPAITVPTSNVAFSVDISWTEFDRENISNIASDFIDVEYSVDNGVNWLRLPTIIGNGLSGHTVCYRNDTGGGQNSGPTNNNGSSTFTKNSISCPNSTIIIRVCAQMNTSPNETITIDNVSVPLGSLGGCTAPTLSTAVRNISCNGGNTGQIDLTVSGGGTPPYMYAWTGGAATEDLTGLALGTYTVTVTDNLNCSATTSATVGTAAPITTSKAINPSTCGSVADGGVDLTVNGGVPPFTYAWTGGAVTQDLENVAAGTYTVTITDAPGCVVTTTATIGTAAAGAYNEDFNVDGQGYLPNFIDNFSAVNWTISSWPLTQGPPANINGRESDDYFRTSGGSLVAIDLDANLCWNSPVLDINPPATNVSFSVNLSWTNFDREGVSNIASDYIDVEYRINGGAWLRVPAQTGGLSGHTISYPNSAASNNNNGSQTVTILGLAGNTLEIRVCSEFNDDGETMSINSVSANSSSFYCPAPESNAGTDRTICANQTATLGATATNGTGVWSVVSGPSTAASQFSSTAAANAVFTPAGGVGTYTLRWTVSASGFPDATDDMQVIVNQLPSASMLAPSQACVGVSFNLAVIPAGAGASYNWSGNGVVNANAPSTTATPTLAGPQTYSITVTAGNTCSTIGTSLVTVNPSPDATITPGSPVCDGGTLNLSVPDAGVGASYSWSGPGVANNNSASTTASLSGTGSKTYLVTVTGSNGCTATGSVSVLVNATPSAVITPSTPVCLNTSFNLSVPDAGMGASYSWSGLGVSNTNTASTSATPTATGSQAYAVTVTTSAGCSATSSVSVTVGAVPDATITGGGVYCGGTTVSLSAPAGGVTYNWGKFDNNQNNPGYPLIGSGNPFSVTKTGMYRVTVTNAAGCTATDITTVVVADFTVNGSLGAGDLQKGDRFFRGLPNATCAAPKICPGTVGGGEVHYYDLHSFTNTRNVPVCATIAITSQCVSQIFMVAFSAAFNPANPCSNYLADPGTSFFPNFTGTMEATVPANGTLTVLVEVTPNGGTCSAYTIYVDMPRDPVVYTFNATPDPVCLNGTLNLSITSGGGGASYSWAGNGVNNTNSNTTTATPTVVGPQTYSVTVTIPGGCASTFTKSVTVAAPPSANITANQASGCGSALINLSVPSAGVGASYNWSGNGVINANSNTTTASPNAAGNQTYNVTVTTAQGCTNTGTTSVNVSICIGGKIIWKTNNTSGVKDVTVAVTGDLNTSVVTPVTGLYSVSTSSGSAFTITPSKALNKMNGVNAQDVQRIQQHLTGLTITDPYLLVAADVNANNGITALDANIIQLAILGNPSALAQFLYSWRFVPTSHTMANPPWGFPEVITLANAGGGLGNLDFYGIKVGDVTAIYANPANSSGQPLLFRAPNERLQAGRTISVDFSADQIAELGAFQMALRFDPTALALSDIQSLSTSVPLTAENFGLTEPGLIRMMWSDANAVAIRQPSPVFRLTFKVLADGGKLSDVLDLDDSVLPAHCYNQEGVESNVSLRFYEVTATNDPLAGNADALVLYQNQPNPFTAETVVGYYLPEANQAVFTVFDVNGKLVYRQQFNAAKGYNQVVLKDAGLPTGLLYYRVETPTDAATRKMIRVE